MGKHNDIDLSPYDTIITIDIRDIRKLSELIKAVRYMKPAWKRDGFGVEYGTMIKRDIRGNETEHPCERTLTWMMQRALDLLPKINND